MHFKSPESEPVSPNSHIWLMADMDNILQIRIRNKSKTILKAIVINIIEKLKVECEGFEQMLIFFYQIYQNQVHVY